jgi:hypothetical protein
MISCSAHMDLDPLQYPDRLMGYSNERTHGGAMWQRHVEMILTIWQAFNVHVDFLTTSRPDGLGRLFR